MLYEFQIKFTEKNAKVTLLGLKIKIVLLLGMPKTTVKSRKSKENVKTLIQNKQQQKCNKEMKFNGIETLRYVYFYPKPNSNISL